MSEHEKLEAVAKAIRDVEDPNQPVSEFHRHAKAAYAAMPASQVDLDLQREALITRLTCEVQELRAQLEKKPKAKKKK